MGQAQAKDLQPGDPRLSLDSSSGSDLGVTLDKSSLFCGPLSSQIPPSSDFLRHSIFVTGVTHHLLGFSVPPAYLMAYFLGNGLCFTLLKPLQSTQLSSALQDVDVCV